MQVALQHVCFAYAGQRVLEDFSLDFPGKGTVCLFGPSGCGKTTLLRLLAGLAHPQAGKVLCPQRVALMFQEDRLLPWATARENVAAVLHLPRAEAAAQAASLLRRLGLAGCMDKRPAALSGGMRQRVALARALAFQPALLLLDEPFHSLDAGARERAIQLLRACGTQQLTIWVTHELAQAKVLSDVVYFLEGPPLRVKGLYRGSAEKIKKL